MDTTTLFGKLTSHVKVGDGKATLPEAPGAGLEASPAYAEIFGGLVH